MRARARPFSIRVSMGNAKAAVFPEPVCARPEHIPARQDDGIACAWMGVGVVKPAALTASITFGLRPRLSKDIYTLKTDLATTGETRAQADYVAALVSALWRGT